MKYTYVTSGKCTTSSNYKMRPKFNLANRRSFRPEYNGIGLIRIQFPGVGICGLSATIPVHVRGFIHRTLRFPTPAAMIQRSIDRPNICIFCLPIEGSLQSFEDLDFVIPKDFLSSENIAKTMIFVDGLKEVCQITTKLLNMIPKSVLKDYPNIVRDYSIGWCNYLIWSRTRLRTLVRNYIGMSSIQLGGFCQQ